MAGTEQLMEKERSTNTKQSLVTSVEFDALPLPRFASCTGCGLAITENFLLKVAPDLNWHVSCLNCTICRCPLENAESCYLRQGHVYCRTDYLRLFGVKCAKCEQPVLRNSVIMQVRDSIFHRDCFHCVVCFRVLQSGEEFRWKNGSLFCSADMDFANNENEGITSLEHSSCHSQHSLHSTNGSGDEDDFSPMSSPLPGTGLTSDSSFVFSNQSLPTSMLEGFIGNRPQQGFNGSNGSPMSSNEGTGDVGGGSSPDGGSGPNNKRKKDPKTTRVRTVLNEKQLHTLRTCYNANPRPDALMKEQLVEMTGLSPRVIRVWFQNKRCKDKKRQILMKHLHQHQEKGALNNGLRLQPLNDMNHPHPRLHDTGHLVQLQELQPPPATLWHHNQKYFPGTLSDDHHLTSSGAYPQLASVFPFAPPSGPTERSTKTCNSESFSLSVSLNLMLDVSLILPT